MRQICFGSGWKLWEVGSKEMILRLGSTRTGLEVDQSDSLSAMEAAIRKLLGISAHILVCARLFLKYGELLL